MQAPDPYPDERPQAPARGMLGVSPARAGGFWVLGERLARVAGLVLALSAFMSWYAGSDDGPTIAVIGWHVGVLGKLVFFVGLAVLALAAAREAGIELPATVPESLVLIGLGSLGTTFVLIRLLTVPDEFFPYTGRGIGIWISLLASLAVIAAGLLEASEEL
ncbi:MAG TPA: hypothetical protein VE444_04640 [Gaiellaceae bacterium]|jgi:hypothetical protein|nr:hypothetical protein [Gaiellaceae bacterium]